MSDLHHFIDRVLTLKSEQDDLSASIKDVYAEARASGFDKTVMGELVTYLRKREKDPTKLEEKGALFAVYLNTYESGTSLANIDRAPVHAPEWPPHDPITGEVIETDTQRSTAVKESQPAPAAEPSPVSSQEPCTHGSGEVQDRCESTSPPIHSDPGDIPECLRRNAA